MRAAKLANGVPFVGFKHCHGYRGTSFERGPRRYGGIRERTRFLREVDGIRASARPCASPYSHRPLPQGQARRGCQANAATIGVRPPRGRRPGPALQRARPLRLSSKGCAGSAPRAAVIRVGGKPSPPSDATPPEGPAQRRPADRAGSLRPTSRASCSWGRATYLQSGCAWPHAVARRRGTGGAGSSGSRRTARGRPLRRKAICRTFSDCTSAPRLGLVSGCFPLDPFYTAHPDAKRLREAKAALA